MNPASAPAGPVLAEYRDGGGTILNLTYCLSGATTGYVWRPPARPVVTAAMVRARAVRLIPRAAVGLAPETATLVNIQTIMWVSAPAAQTLPVVQMLGQRVTIRLVSDHVVYDYGDGESDADAPRGKPYDDAHDPCRTAACPDYFGHVYTVSGRRTVTATAYWRASFTVGGGAVQQIPGTVPGPVSSATVTVKQARAVLVPDH